MVSYEFLGDMYPEALEYVRELEEALREAQLWLINPSDTYPQHYEELSRVRQQVRDALAISSPVKTAEKGKGVEGKGLV